MHLLLHFLPAAEAAAAVALSSSMFYYFVSAVVADLAVKRTTIGSLIVSSPIQSRQTF